MAQQQFNKSRFYGNNASGGGGGAVFTPPTIDISTRPECVLLALRDGGKVLGFSILPLGGDPPACGGDSEAAVPYCICCAPMSISVKRYWCSARKCPVVVGQWKELQVLQDYAPPVMPLVFCKLHNAFFTRLAIRNNRIVLGCYDFTCTPIQVSTPSFPLVPCPPNIGAIMGRIEAMRIVPSVVEKFWANLRFRLGECTWDECLGISEGEIFARAGTAGDSFLSNLPKSYLTAYRKMMKQPPVGGPTAVKPAASGTTGGHVAKPPKKRVIAKKAIAAAPAPRPTKVGGVPQARGVGDEEDGEEASSPVLILDNGEESETSNI